MVSPFAQHVAAYISRHHMFTIGDRLLCAVSGGKDSVVMTHVLHQLGYHLAIAHVNFGLRGLESDGDAQFVAQLAEEMGVPHISIRFDTENETRPGESIQMAARRLRYQWFPIAAKELDCKLIATAHTANDNAETLLYHIIKGTGVQGMIGIPPTNGNVVRPLLDCSTEQVVQYASSQGLAYMTDSSNLSSKYARNYLRHNVLPLFETLNPAWVDTVRGHAARWQRIATAYHHYVALDIDRHFEWNEKGYYACDFQALRSLPHGHNLLMEALLPLGFGAGHIDEMWHAYTGAKWLAANYVAYLYGNALLIGQVAEEMTEEKAIDLGKDGSMETRLGVLSWRQGTPAERNLLREPGYALIPTKKLPETMVLTQPKTGERFRPYGMKGSQLISDYLTNTKHNPIEKAQVYLLTDSLRIAWVLGLRIDQHYSLSDDDEEFMVFQWDKKTQTPFGLGRRAVVSNL